MRLHGEIGWSRLIFVQTIHAQRAINAWIMAMIFRVNAPKDEAVLIAIKSHERYVSLFCPPIFASFLNWFCASIEQMQ